MMFTRKPVFCTMCKKQITHKHKPKKEWNIKGPLCADCHLDKMKEFYEGTIKQKCRSCKVTKKITDLWEPRWQWDMEGLLCKNCFEKKENEFNVQKEFCSVCGTKLGFFRFNPKTKWELEGKLCRNCWDTQKAKHG